MNNTELLREAVALLKKAHPAINPSAMDTERMTGNPASECWIKTMVRSFTERADVQAALASQASKGAGVDRQAPEDLFDLIREWAHLPEGQRGDAARNIIGCVNRSYSAGVADGRVLGALAAQAQPPAYAVLSDLDIEPFAYFVQPSSFGPFIECKPDQVGSFLAYRALAAKPAEDK